MSTPIVSGDDDASRFSIVAIAGLRGGGRVVAIGHEGFFWNQDVDRFDNRRFALNVFTWLDQRTSKNVLWTEGHGEWLQSNVQFADAYYIRRNLKKDARRNSLIAAAGNDRMNYLRSMFPDGTFTSAPQEFFASIANQWFCDTKHTLNLALQRFSGGRKDPINQFLFFAETYSLGTDSTLFYTLDVRGNLMRRAVALKRNAYGQIQALNVDGLNYDFVLDNEGNVAGFAVTDVMPAKSVIPVSYGLSQNYPNPFNPRTTIRYQLPTTSFVSLRVYDLLGREVATVVNVVMGAGVYSADFDLPHLQEEAVHRTNEGNLGSFSSGVLFYRLQAGPFVSVKCMLLLK